MIPVLMWRRTASCLTTAGMRRTVERTWTAVLRTAEQRTALLRIGMTRKRISNGIFFNDIFT